MLLNVGSGGGAAAAPAASGGAAAAASGDAPAGDKKEEKKEEGKSSMVFGGVCPQLTCLCCPREGRVRRGHGLRSFRLVSRNAISILQSEATSNHFSFEYGRA